MISCLVDCLGTVWTAVVATRRSYTDGLFSCYELPGFGREFGRDLNRVRRVSLATQQDVHAAPVAIFVMSKRGDQPDDTQRQIAPGPNTDRHVSHPMRVVPIWAYHLEALSSLGFLVERGGAISAQPGTLPGRTEFFPDVPNSGWAASPCLLRHHPVDPVDLAVEFTRVVPVSGNMTVCGQQFWLGPDRAGSSIAFWADTTVVHLLANGVRLKTVPSRLTVANLQRLLAEGARPAGPRPIPSGEGGDPIEVDRLVNGTGLINLAGRQHPIGYHFAGRRLTVRLDHGLLQLVQDGMLLRSLPNPLTPSELTRIRDARPAGPPPQPAAEPVQVERRVSSRGAITIARQRIHIGIVHAGRTLTVESADHTFRIYDGDQLLAETGRTTTKPIARFKVRKPEPPRQRHPAQGSAIWH